MGIEAIAYPHEAMHSSYILDKLNRVALHMGTELPSREELMEALFRVGAASIDEGRLSFTFAKLLSYPRLLRPLLELLYRELEGRQFNFLMGGDFEGALFASYLSLEKQIPQLAALNGKLLGEYFPGQRVILLMPLVEEPVTLLKLMELFIKEGLSTEALLTLIDLEDGMHTLLRQGGLAIHSVFTLSEFLKKG